MAKSVTESLALFLGRKKMALNADLVERYCPSMECQLLVRKARVNRSGAAARFSPDGVRTWWSIRVPKDSAIGTALQGLPPHLSRWKPTLPTSGCRAGIGNTLFQVGWLRA